MKNRIFPLLLFCLAQNAHAQVSGKLLTPGGQAVPFANVLLLKAMDTSIVKTALSDEKGSYLLSSPEPGRYILRLTSMGYESWDSPVFELTVSQPGKNFETLILKETARQLGAVTIAATKPLYQQQAEGIVMNVESSVLTKGSSVLALLERSPGVTIDYRNNSIALNGKSGVAVMLNGKLMRLPVDQVVNLLTGMSGNDVEKIELLTTPGARYDAEGSAGIINIVLKKNRQQGMNGSLTVTGGYGKGEKGMGSIRLANNSAGSHLYGSYNFSHNRTYSDMYIDSDQDMPVFGGQMNVLGWDTARIAQNNHDVSLGFDRNITPKVLIGVSLSYNNSSTSSATVNRAIYHVLPDSLLNYAGAVKGMNRWRNGVGAVYIEKEIREGEKINVDVDYLFFKNSNPSVVQSIFMNKTGTTAGGNDPLFSPQQRGFANTAIHVAVGKVDYTKTLAKNVKLAAGVKGTYTKSASSSRIESMIDHEWVNRIETAEDIEMKEAIGAAYATVTTQINPRVSLTLGARYEYANTKMSNPVTGKNPLNRRQGVLFPEISFSKKLNEASALQLSYSKRISRPSYNDLASYVTYSDPTAVYTGNPLLQPTITNNIKLGYNYNGYTFSLLFSRDEHPIARYQLTERPAANLLYVSPQNLLYQNNITLQVNLPWKVTDWWNMDYGFSGGLRQFKLDYTREPVNKAYFGYTLNFNESFELPEDFTMELSGWYNSLFYNGSVKVGGMGALNAGVKKELKNNWGTIQLAWTDILRTVKINVYYGTLTEEAFAIKNHVAIHTESGVASVLKLTYTKSFGSGAKGPGKRDIGSKAEGERIRKE
ncbi:TonB-dependent receptor domain-containing protein [Chitinophaga sp. RAB17]|uniref:TonB-dependent receptor domain-containing protein n=1 Tax=Chitinophaga sp. RAB17 TaxID=3233049 RepID=UPI003F8F6C81